jgi:hypothetical protein
LALSQENIKANHSGLKISFGAGAKEHHLVETDFHRATYQSIAFPSLFHPPRSQEMRSHLGAPVADDVLAGLENGESPHVHAGYKRPIRHGIEIVSQEFDLMLLHPHLRRSTALCQVEGVPAAVALC